MSRRDHGRARSGGRAALRLVAMAAALALPVGCDAGGTDGAGARPGQAGERAARDGDSAAGQARASDTTAGGAAASGTATIRVGGVPVRVEIAEDPDRRRQGLMHRDSLPADRGMLFVYPEEQTLSFWMRNTRIPLDIAYIDQRGYIVDIQQMEPGTDHLYESSSPAMYALEVNRGWFEKHGIQEGDRVQF